MKPLLLVAALALVSFTGCAKNLPAQLRVYVAVDRTAAEQVLAEFTRQTGISIEPVFDTEAAKTAGLARRLELERDKPWGDVWWSGESLYTALLAQKGLFADLAADTPQAARKHGGAQWTGFSARLRVLAWHAKHWPEGMPEPTSLNDFLDPRLKGRCAMAKPVLGTTATHAAWLAGSEEGRALLRGARENGLMLVISNSAVVRALAVGDAWLGLTDSDDALILQKQYPGLRFVIPDQAEGATGAVFTPASAAIVKGCARPGPAARFVQWLASRAGEDAMAKSAMRFMPIASDAPVPEELPAKEGLRLARLDHTALARDWESTLAFVRELFEL